jgi:hypothetical protein
MIGSYGVRRPRKPADRRGCSRIDGPCGQDWTTPITELFPKPMPERDVFDDEGRLIEQTAAGRHSQEMSRHELASLNPSRGDPIVSGCQGQSGVQEYVCCSRMQAEAGQALSAIVRRKEMERRAGRGQFSGAWGTLLLIRPATEAAPLRFEPRAAAELAQGDQGSGRGVRVLPRYPGQALRARGEAPALAGDPI